ncbi:MAG TPA: macrolide transporter subunit MacA [Beijerinckiaceae bacterium]|jgi:macrolide-specific efflux system membrane fusion protein
MQMIRSRAALLGFAALLVFSFGAIAARHYFTGATPPAYLTAGVVRADLQHAVMATGVLQAYRQVDVGAQASGQLKSLKVRLGDPVAKGELLAELDPVLSQNALRFARASLESLQAQRRAVAANSWQAELSLRRQEKMMAKDATSRQELEAAKAQLQVLSANLASFDAQISQARAQVDTAQANLAYTQITAPIDGVVVAIVTQEGQTVVAAQQAPVILKLANLQTMTVKAQVSEADIVRLQPGQKAYFTILGDSDERHFGSLRAIEPAPQEISNGGANTSGPVFYNALFEASNQDQRLRIGMTAQVTVVLSEAKNALSIPIAALGTRARDGRYAVRVAGPGGAIRTVMVAIGINDRVNVQVLEGLQEGDQVVTAETAGKRAGAGS